MKGQYLAVESVLTIGMGLTLAIGTINIIGQYQDQIVDSTRDKQIETVHYRVKSALYNMRGADYGRTEIHLPEEIGGADYRVVIDDGVKVVMPGREYSSALNNFNSSKIQGSVEGGTVTLYKSGNQYTLRSN